LRTTRQRAFRGKGISAIWSTSQPKRSGKVFPNKSSAAIQRIMKTRQKWNPAFYVEHIYASRPDNINTFCKRFLEELSNLCVKLLLIAHGMGLLKLGDISMDGTKPVLSEADVVKLTLLTVIHASCQPEWRFGEAQDRL